MQEVLLSATVIRPRELGTACKSEVWPDGGKTAEAEGPRVDLLRDQEGEAVLEVTGGCWTGLAHSLPLGVLRDAKFVRSLAVRIPSFPLLRIKTDHPNRLFIVRALRLRIIAYTS